MRDWGRLRHNDRSLWWPILSRNKRCVALNLREPEGQRIAGELAANADIILENFRPGTMEKWGLGPEDVHARNPRAIYARVSGYGQTGRYRDRPGFASAGEAISGLRHINGYPDQAPPRSASRSATRWRRSRRSRASCSPCTPASAGPRARSSTPRSSTRASR